ncbi:MAG TPA: redoxin domain-containing protein [Candidatus Polarisedimenticolia bacterium]|nr:redoxin domain-containing protein [Candidatus Polarisedimenticolia bacterium]
MIHRAARSLSRRITLLALAAFFGAAPLFADDPHVHTGVPDKIPEHPDVGEDAPPFSLKDTAGKRLDLGEVLGRGYVVVAFGSASSSNFRKSAPEWDRLAREWEKLEVRVLVVYTREAHPATLRGRAPKSYRERELLAGELKRELRLGLRVLVDQWDDAVHRAYGAIPDGAFLLDPKGKILLRQVVARPAGIEQELRRLLKIPEPAG